VNDDDVWAAIDLQRQRTANLLEQLSDDEWQQPSLCPGWMVRDVAAHLTLQQQGLTDALRYLIRNPGSLGGLNRTIRVSARTKARVPVEELVGEIRATIGSRRHNVGVTHLETLIDILVHGQDIAIPLQRELQMPASAAAAAATRVWSYAGKGKARVFDNIPLRGFRLTATDTLWSVGEGSEVRGPIDALLLLLTGRLAAVPRLAGDGADELRKRLLPLPHA
jgi:uncharacterized protein (TIGR03083 family)